MINPQEFVFPAGYYWLFYCLAVSYAFCTVQLVGIPLVPLPQVDSLMPAALTNVPEVV